MVAWGYNDVPGLLTTVDQFRGEYEPLDEDEEFVALVGQLESRRFLHQLSTFVQEVDRIKGMAAKGWTQESDKEEPVDEYVHEFEGAKDYDRGKRVVAACDHGPVANRLAKDLPAAGYTVHNDRFRDLWVTGKNGQAEVLFEVKTDLAPQSVYTAIGQLMYHGAGQQPLVPKLVVVLPLGLDTDAELRMSHLGIKILHYGLTEDVRGVRFHWRDPRTFMETE